MTSARNPMRPLRGRAGTLPCGRAANDRETPAVSRRSLRVPPPLLLLLLHCALVIPGIAAEAAGSHPLMTDDLGDTLLAGPYPQKIVSLSPSITEMLFAIGVDSARIAGVTSYCDYPPAATRRPRVGGIVDPSMERLQMIRPDLVLATRGNPVSTLSQIRALGIPVFATDDRASLEGIGSIMTRLALLLGPEDQVRTDSCLAAFHRLHSRYRAWSDSIPQDRRPRVLLVDPQNPDWSAGPGSHVDALIRLAGGRNVIEGGPSWPRISSEFVLSRDPDLLLVAAPPGQGRDEISAQLLARPGWRVLRALRHEEGAVEPPAAGLCLIDTATLLRPGPRMFGALIEMAECFHPGATPATSGGAGGR